MINRSSGKGAAISQMDIVCASPEQTIALGATLGRMLRAGDLVCLSGDLGGGKTVFSCGIGDGWGAIPPVTSPTYNLIHEHRRADGTKLYHIDLYRISDAEEAATIGIEDILGDAAPAVVEWPERLGAHLPQHNLWIDFEIGAPNIRLLTFSASGSRHRLLLAQFQSQIDSRMET